ncbi:MAG TPA: type I restriction enzyme HsdR N-terminal domain-containing protein [Bacillota bacterium]|nr:type I restriction enzyme HsdR N-terminal domain-containing protein [Bacillota bacterium]
MSELDVALNKVLPHLVNNCKFANEIIQGYGRVPIQMGSSVVWADFVCNYYTTYGQKKAFCVVEVKECKNDDVDFAIPQAESYAQRLNAPFFCCTNGETYKWFMTGASQGEYILLAGLPTLPDAEYMKKPDKIYITPYLYESINNFEAAIKLEKGIYEDSKWHHDVTENLHAVLTDNTLINNQQVVIESFNKNTMESRGKTILITNMENDYSRFLRLVDRLRDTSIPVEARIENAVGGNSQFGIAQGGLFFISQLLAALFPKEFTVIEPNATKAMQRFNLTDINFEVSTTRDYLYFNEICNDLYKYFENPFSFNLSYVHNFLWHYEKEFYPNKSWD